MVLIGSILALITQIISAVSDTDSTKANYSSGIFRKCPYCANEIKREAVVCQFCNKDIPFLPSHKVKLLTNYEGMSIRKEPDARLEPFTKLPEGTEIEYLETGYMADLNGKKAPWFKIKNKENICGWCFPGSLEKI